MCGCNEPTNFPKFFKIKYFQIFDQSDPSIFCHFRELIDTIVTTHTPNIVNFRIFSPDGNMTYEHQTKTRWNYFWWAFILWLVLFYFLLIPLYRKWKNIKFSKLSLKPAAIDINPYSPRILVKVIFRNSKYLSGNKYFCILFRYDESDCSLSLSVC